MISKKTIDDIFSVALVEEVIGDFVHLKRSGSNYKGLSPFVDEKTPSFMVSPAKQIWKCFSSGKGGNAVSFLMELEQYSYPEALRYLAKKYQITIEEDRTYTDEEKEKRSERESLMIVSDAAATYFSEQMYNTSKGKSIALGYFKERGFREETLKTFQLGYNPDEWTAFTNYALEKGYQLQFLEKTGLSIVKQDKQFDRFKGRVMFPIHNFSGRVIAFGGRTLSADKKVAKYLNSPESPIYHKSDVLYGIYQAKNSIIKYNQCFLVEGYTDVISMYQSGVQNVVSSSGTALTENQIKLIKRLTHNIVVIYDGDAAGIRASFRGIDLLLAQEMNIKVLLLPNGEDPDSFAKSKSSDEFISYLKEHQTDFVQFKTQVLLEEAKGDPIKRANLIKDVLRSISIIPDLIKRQVYVTETSQLLNVPEKILFNQLQAFIQSKQLKKIPNERFNQLKIQTKEPQKKIHPTLDRQKVVLHLEKNLLRLMLLYGNTEVLVLREEATFETKAKFENTLLVLEVVEELLTDDLEMINPIHQIVFKGIIDLLESGSYEGFSNFVNHGNLEVVALVSDLVSEKYKLHDWERKGVYIKKVETRLGSVISDLINEYRSERIKLEIKNLEQKIRESKEENKTEYLQKMVRLLTVKNLLVTKIGRII